MRPFLAALLLPVMLLAGCASTGGPGTHAGDPYVVNSQRTLFYTFGPAQASGPDFALTHGQRVAMLSYQYGYSHVAITATGQSGYVPTEDLAPAPPLPKATPPPALAASGSRHHHEIDDEPLLTPEEEAKLPLPIFPDSMPPPNAPPFRY